MLRAKGIQQVSYLFVAGNICEFKQAFCIAATFAKLHVTLMRQKMMDFAYKKTEKAHHTYISHVVDAIFPSTQV
jgi:hypothetical protein